MNAARFDWLPVLNFLQGKRPPLAGGVWGIIPIAEPVWIETYDGKIHAYPPDFKTRHTITIDDAKKIYQRRQIQPTLFDL